MKTSPIILNGFLILVLLVSSCNKNNEAAFTDTPIVEAYLQNGHYFSVNISRQIPFSPNVAIYSSDDIDNLEIIITCNGISSVLEAVGGGIYADSSIIVTEGDEYTLTFTYNDKTVHAYTYVPTKPVNVTQSVTSITMDKMDSTSGPPSGSMPDPIQINWDNTDESYYLIVVENLESDPEPIRDFGDDGDAPERIFRKSPTNSSYEEINPIEFEYFGTYRVVLFHVLPDYASLYEQNSTSSQNLTNPSTCIENGYGIFTGLNSDTLYIEVIEN
ncbi:MAG: hypothetical protein CVU11_04490 [Bacteroidetes bacterium HGW-Bacteroidetes-6]|jgi:hypothetical protein|nr:MAG: hypothetical protein CVU11_04490 [Bacteroidetes bacterium HGW-Bacteroidetes-6]